VVVSSLCLFQTPKQRGSPALSNDGNAKDVIASTRWIMYSWVNAPTNRNAQPSTEHLKVGMSKATAALNQILTRHPA